MPTIWDDVVIDSSAALLADSPFQIFAGLASTLQTALKPFAATWPAPAAFLETGKGATFGRNVVVSSTATAERHNIRQRPGDIAEKAVSAMGQFEHLTPAQNGVRGVVVVFIDEPQNAASIVNAFASRLPLFWQKANVKTNTFALCILGKDGQELTGLDLAVLRSLFRNIRSAARLVDTPPNILHSDAFVEIAKAVVAPFGSNVKVTHIRGDELKERGLGLIHSVGQASVHPASLVVLERPARGEPVRTVCMVGKGIVYDTGGLSIKTKEGMPGMKTDMGGAAAVLQAFQHLTESNLAPDHTVLAVLCISENSVGPHATRPDDVVVGYSGLSVEINNTDAEGRLVLSDGVAYAARHYPKIDYMIDIATLTGAQGIATGKNHAAILCNSDSLEQQALRAGYASGDLVFPIPFAPEFHEGEFSSSVADMKNSVKDRSNAQSSCAGTFVYSHLKNVRDMPWLHIDMAYPSHRGDRGTGYGVALLSQLVQQL